MNIMLPRALVLDLLQKAEQVKNETTGKYEDTGLFKKVLVVYPYGQDIKYGRAGVISADIDAVRVKQVESLVGKVAMIELDQETTKSGAVFYKFINIYDSPSVKAA